MNAVGFGIPGSGVVLRPNAVIVGLLVGTIVTIVSAIVPARQAARVPPIAAMRERRARAADQRARRIGIGGVITRARVVAAASSGCSAAAASRSSALGALLMLVGVFVLSPLFARAARAGSSVCPLTKIKGVTGSLVARERGPEPAAHGDDRRRGDDRACRSSASSRSSRLRPTRRSAPRSISSSRPTTS